MGGFVKCAAPVAALVLAAAWLVGGVEERYVTQLDPTSNFTTGPPSVLGCAERLLDVGFEEIEDRILPCAFGPVPTCCDSINPVFKLEYNGPGAGCLCNELLLVEIVDQLKENELAALIGFDQERLFVVFQGCGTQFLLGRGEATCPGLKPGGDIDDDDEPPQHVIVTLAPPADYHGGGVTGTGGLLSRLSKRFWN